MILTLFVIIMCILCKINASLENLLIQEQEKFQQFDQVLRTCFKDTRSLVWIQPKAIENIENTNLFARILEDYVYYNFEASHNGVTEFNGVYNTIYSDFVTYEESKLYLLQPSSIEDFGESLKHLRKIYFWRMRDRLAIIMAAIIDYSEMVEVLTAYRIVNAIFVHPNGSVFTFELREGNIVETIDGDYFYDKMRDYRGVPVRISMFMHVRDAIPTGTHYHGRDGLLARTFMHLINATGVYTAPEDGIQYGENRGNHNITGVFGDVARNRTDVALNSRMMKPEFENVVEYTYPHDRDDLVVLVPCGLVDEKFEYYKSFQPPVWIAIGVFNLGCLMVFWTTRSFDRFTTAALYTFGMFFGQSYSRTRAAIGRSLVLLYTFYSFLIVVHYTSLLMSIITVPHKPREIDTFEELAASKLKMYTVERYKRYLVLYGEEAIKRLDERIFIVSEKQVMQLIDEHGHYAVICKRSVADWAVLHHKNYRGGRMMHRIMKKSPFPAIVCYIVKYGSPLKLTLNAYMQRIIESGVQDYWMDTTLNIIFTQQNKLYQLAWNPEKKIALDQVGPVFLLYTIAILLAMISFFLEICSLKLNSRELLNKNAK